MKIKSIALVATAVISSLMMSVTSFAATNELTGLEVSDAIAAQRPVAIMVDNEKKALKHYGTAEADIVLIHKYYPGTCIVETVEYK